MLRSKKQVIRAMVSLPAPATRTVRLSYAPTPRSSPDNARPAPVARQKQAKRNCIAATGPLATI
ncbi:hypothetical protein ACUXQ2_000218 [Cupriavidus metallidurans]